MATPYSPIVLPGGRLCLSLTGRPLVADSTGAASCLCSVPGSNCVPVSNSCPCASGCGTSAGSRTLITATPAGQTTVYSVPYTCCCGATNIAWSLSAAFRYYDKGNACAGLILRHSLDITGAGTDAGSVTWRNKVYDGDGSLTSDTTGVVFIGPASCAPASLLARAIQNSAFLAANLSGASLLLRSLTEMGSPAEIGSASAYSDCTSYVGRQDIGAGLGSSNPCSGIRATSVVVARIFHAGCIVPGSTCGACCCRGECFDGLSPAQCSAMGGTPQGNSSRCVDTACPAGGITATGACCLKDGSCLEGVTPSSCSGYLGIFRAGLPCSGAACQAMLRACCHTDGSCTNETELACALLGGSWSTNLVCAQVQCQPSSLGVCCLTDGSCQTIDSNACAGLGGYWRDGVGSCSTGACTGGCCTGGGHGFCECSVTSIQECALLIGCGGNPNGSFLGFNTGCSPDPCMEGGGGIGLDAAKEVRRRSQSFGGFRGGCGSCGGGGIVVAAPGDIVAVSKTRNRR